MGRYLNFDNIYVYGHINVIAIYFLCLPNNIGNNLLLLMLASKHK